jgi:hypothetical protein
VDNLFHFDYIASELLDARAITAVWRGAAGGVWIWGRRRCSCRPAPIGGLVCHAELSMVAVLLRVAWRSVSDFVTRVVAARAGPLDRVAELCRIRSMRFLTAKASGPKLGLRGEGL